MKVVTVSGTPRDRGRVIGETLRHDIRTVIDKLALAIETGRGYSPAAYFTALDKYSDYVAAAERWAPDLLEEVRGLAEGAAIEFETAMRLQLLDEDWFFDAYHYAPAVKVQHKCTVFGIVDEGNAPTYAGQNMDIMSSIEGHQVLLRIQYPDSDLESLVFTHAGLIGLCGMNNSPLGVNCNTLMQLGCCPDGLPVAFITRSLLGMNTFDEAVVFLNTIKHAVGQNYTLSTFGRVAAFECSPNRVAEYRPEADGRRLVHTNHPLVNDDTDSFEKLAKVDPKGAWVRGEGNSRSRLASMRARTLDHETQIGLDELKSALRAKDDPDNPVCRDWSTDTGASVISFTAGSLIYELAERSQLHLAAGPPSQSEFLTFEFLT